MADRSGGLAMETIALELTERALADDGVLTLTFRRKEEKVNAPRETFISPPRTRPMPR